MSGRRAPGGAEDRVATVEQRTDGGVSETREQGAQLRHRHALCAADVHTAQQGYEPRHARSNLPDGLDDAQITLGTCSQCAQRLLVPVAVVCRSGLRDTVELDEDRALG